MPCHAAPAHAAPVLGTKSPLRPLACGLTSDVPTVGEWSAGPKAFVYEGDATIGGLDKNLMRYETKCDLFLKSASWHCTDCFPTLADVQAKVASFSHWEKNRFPYNDSAFIVDRTVRHTLEWPYMQGLPVCSCALLTRLVSLCMLCQSNNYSAAAGARGRIV